MSEDDYGSSNDAAAAAILTCDLDNIDARDETASQLINCAIQDCGPAFNKFRVNSNLLPKKRRKSAPKKAAAKTLIKTSTKENPGELQHRATRSKTQNALSRDVEVQRESMRTPVLEGELDEPPAKKAKVTKKAITISSECDISSEEEAVAKGKGKAKARKPVDEDHDEFEAIVYLYVERPPLKPAPRSSSGSRIQKPTEEEKYLSRGLVTVKGTTDYFDFCLKISMQLPCPLNNIVEDKMVWKFRTPQNSTFLPLGGEVGYDSMIKLAKKRKEDARVILLAMPPPVQPTEEKVFWETSLKKTADDKSFDYSQLDLGGSTASENVAAQLHSFDKSVAPCKDALLEKYPENNHPDYPNKRIYTDTKMNTDFELTNIRLDVWASHLARDTATIDKPPISSHFNYDGRIKSKPAKAAQPLLPQITVTQPSASPSPASTPNLIEILLVNMIQQQAQQNRFPLFPTYPFLAPDTASQMAGPAELGHHGRLSLATTAPPNVASAPQSPARGALPSMSLSDFCDRYMVNATDQARLGKLEFRPGDKIAKLSESDWKDFAGFTTLSWQRILDKNKAFLHDAQNGLLT